MSTRGKTWFLRVCLNGHDKPHPGRCKICLALKDKRRALKPHRAQNLAAAAARWESRNGKTRPPRVSLSVAGRLLRRAETLAAAERYGFRPVELA